MSFTWACIVNKHSFYLPITRQFLDQNDVKAADVCISILFKRLKFLEKGFSKLLHKLFLFYTAVSNKWQLIIHLNISWSDRSNKFINRILSAALLILLLWILLDKIRTVHFTLRHFQLSIKQQSFCERSSNTLINVLQHYFLLNGESCNCSHWRTDPLADLGGHKGHALPQPKFLHFHAVFGKNWSNSRFVYP